MLRILIAVSVLLTLSLSVNYLQFEKSKTSQIVIDSQKESVKEFQKQVKELQENGELVISTFKSVDEKVQKSDISFNDISRKLITINCTKASNDESKATGGNLVDSDVTTYYDLLHSAYNLQNKN